MTPQERQIVEKRCQTGTNEYVSVVKRMPLSYQLKTLSLSAIRLQGEDEVLRYYRMVEKILGFKPGQVDIRIRKSGRGGGQASPWEKIVWLYSRSNLQTIIHELVHILADNDTHVPGYKKEPVYDEFGYVRRRNDSIHNAGFTEWLMVAMDNVLEHAGELGIRVFSAEDVLNGKHWG